MGAIRSPSCEENRRLCVPCLTPPALRRSCAGFTLVEILIVLVIIGITIALVSVNFRRDAKGELRDEALRLSLLLEAARTEAITTGKSLAWIATPPSYGFYKRDEERRWTVPLNDPPLSQGTLPAQIALADVRINRAQVPVDTPLVFSASGFNPSFRLELAAGRERMLVYGDAGGNIGTAEVSQ